MKRIIILSVLLLTSCLNSSIHNKNVFFQGTFLKIEKKILISACHPVNINKCITKRYESSASSFLIKNKKDKSYLITAAHVCVTSMGKLSTLPKFSYSEQFYGIDQAGRIFKYKVVAVNNMYDLCLISTKRMNTKAYRIASLIPDRGEKIYNIAAPVGIFGKNLVPLFTGLYNGKAHGRGIFSLPAIGGSSGSPILNSNGEVVGVVSAVTKGFNNLVLSPTLKQIQEFIENEKL